MNKKIREQRRQEELEARQGEIAFQLSRFRYDKSIFYIEGGNTKTWFAVEDTGYESDITHTSQVTVKDLNTFITAGIALSIQEKITVSEVIPIIHQSLYVPLGLEMMMKIITAQSGFVAAKWNHIYPGALFLGTKLRVVKATGHRNVMPSLRHEKGQIYYPAMTFREYIKTKENVFKGLWLPEVVHEDDRNYNFSAAVAIQT